MEPVSQNIRALTDLLPWLEDAQVSTLCELAACYRDWNDKVNLISRKDIDHVFDHHILHSLTIAAFIRFAPGSRIIDLGTGGGLPGLPLAIAMPDVQFKLIDARRKKINVIHDIIEQLGLKNVTASHGRVEEIKGEKYDFIVSRAVAPAAQLWEWSHRLISSKEQNPIPNGYLLLKGGDLIKEMSASRHTKIADIMPLSAWLVAPYYNTKSLVYIPR